MNDKAEIRLAKIEHEIKAAKAQYPVAASLVEFKRTESDIFSFSGQGGQALELKIFEARFTPKNSRACLVYMYPQVASKSDFSTNYPKVNFYSMPQAADGSVICRTMIQLPGGAQNTYNFYVRFVAVGSDEGIITRI